MKFYMAWIVYYVKFMYVIYIMAYIDDDFITLKVRLYFLFAI